MTVWSSCVFECNVTGYEAICIYSNSCSLICCHTRRLCIHGAGDHSLIHAIAHKHKISLTMRNSNNLLINPSFNVDHKPFYRVIWCTVHSCLNA
eukprot:Gb_31584 [translate_table: standard]